MMRLFNALTTTRHLGVGVMEGIALAIIHELRFATARTIAETMGLPLDNALQLVSTLRKKSMIELDRQIPRARKRQGSANEKAWRTTDALRAKLDIFESTGKPFK